MREKDAWSRTTPHKSPKVTQATLEGNEKKGRSAKCAAPFSYYVPITRTTRDRSVDQREPHCAAQFEIAQAERVTAWAVAVAPAVKSLKTVVAEAAVSTQSAEPAGVGALLGVAVQESPVMAPRPSMT